MSPMTITDKLSMPPPPVLSMTRPASMLWILGTSSPMRKPTKNTAMEARRIGLRPKMSLNLPHGGIAAVVMKCD